MSNPRIVPVHTGIEKLAREALSRASAAADSDSAALSAPDASRGSLRPAILSALTDLFVSRADPDGQEINHFEELALQLLPASDAATCAHVAARLALSRHAPITVIDTLLHKDRVCAVILLEHCQRLPPDTLFDVATGSNAAAAAVLARRSGLSRSLIDVLTIRTEAQVRLALVQNLQAELSEDYLASLIPLAAVEPELARALCARIDDTGKLMPLFLDAAPEQRAKILREAEQAGFTAAEIKHARTASPALLDWLLARGMQGRWNLAAPEIARLTGFERALIERLIADQQGDGLAILLAAIGCPVERAIRLLLTCPPEISHSYERVKALAEIVETMPAHAAYRLMRHMRPAPAAGVRPAYRPLHDPTASATPNRPGTVRTIRRAPLPVSQMGILRRK